MFRSWVNRIPLSRGLSAQWPLLLFPFVRIPLPRYHRLGNDSQNARTESEVNIAALRKIAPFAAGNRNNEDDDDYEEDDWVVSLPIRQYLGGGILTRERRSRGHRAESPRDGGTRFTQLRNTCSKTGPTAACLELSGRFRVVTMSCVLLSFFEICPKGSQDPAYIGARI